MHEGKTNKSRDPWKNKRFQITRDIALVCSVFYLATNTNGALGGFCHYLFSVIYATLFFAVRFVVTFESLAKTFQFLKMICGDYSRSYFNLFLIYTVAHNTQTFTNMKAVLIVQKVDLIQQYCVILTYSFHRNCSCLGS